MRSLRWFVALACASALAVSSVPALAGASAPRVRIKSLTLGRRVLPATGGATALHLKVANGSTCWVTAPTAVRVNRSHRGCRHGRFATVVRVAASDSVHPSHFRLYAWVHGRDGRTIKRAVVLGERGLAPLEARFSAKAQPVVGTAYAGRLVATGGRGPYTWNVAGGSLPPGLTLSRTGALGGTPTTAGSYSADVTVSDASVPVHLARTVKLALSVAPPPLRAASTSLPRGAVGVSYSATLSASGGIGPFKWAVISGALPAGITLSSSGQLAGTPTTAGTYTVGVEVSDSSPTVQRVSESISIVVEPPPLAVTPTAPRAYENSPYSFALSAAGGTAPYQWSIVSGALPAGLALSTTGVISGTPTTAGTATATVRVSDASNPQESATASIEITVAASLAIVTKTSLSATKGTKYSVNFQATGGVAPDTWTWAASGTSTLPAGMSFSSTGTLSGTPSTGTYTFIVEVTDSSSPLKLTAEETVTLTVS